MPRPTISYQTRDGRTITVEAVYQHVKGYAAPPGGGPTGKTCGTCKNLIVREFANRYFKCGLIDYTGGPGTDIRKKSPACKHWEVGKGKE